MREELKDVTEGRVDIVIGTQIVAKGIIFPKTQSVGIIDADLGLAMATRAPAERTFQLLNQVAGPPAASAAGNWFSCRRHQPHHPVMKALIACDAKTFYANEIEAREKAALSASSADVASLVVSAGERHAAMPLP